MENLIFWNETICTLPKNKNKNFFHAKTAKFFLQMVREAMDMNPQQFSLIQVVLNIHTK